jgi:hypothetical protein
MRPRRQYRLLQAAFLFALIGVAFFGGYAGMHPYSDNPDEAAKRASHEADEGHKPQTVWGWITGTPESAGTIILCFITLGLSLVTGGLYIATVRIARGSEEASAAALTASTTATNLAREEFLASHRPELKIHFIRILEFEPKPPPDEQAVRVKFGVMNIGTSKAFVTGSAVYLEYLYRTDLRYLPELKRNDEIAPRRFMVGATDSYIISGDRWSGSIHVHGAHMGPEFKKLYLYGWIVYEDALKAPRTMYFCRRYRPKLGRFVPVDDPDYEGTY